MRRKWYRRAVVVALLGALLWVGWGRAQAATHVASLRISLWPEYDKPAVLVMYDIVLPDDVTLPQHLEIPIPRHTGGPYAVAYEPPDHNMVNAEYTYREQGDWGMVTLDALMRVVHIEYYDTLQKKGKRRQFTFTWPGAFAVDALTLTVQQPPHATNMHIEPKLGDKITGNDGLVYYQAPLGALQAGQRFEVSLSYDKEDDTLTLQEQQPEDTVPQVAQATPTKEGLWEKAIPIAAVALGIVLIAIGLLWYWRGERPLPASVRPAGWKASREPLPPEALAADMESEEVRYCPRCGVRAQPGDKFCRMCGARLR